MHSVKKTSRSILVGAVLALCLIWPGHVRAQAGSEIGLRTDVTELNKSGVFGQATVHISAEGLTGELVAHNLTPGYGYTTWLFYIESGRTGGPGRFDSNVAQTGELALQGHVGGLEVSSGATIKLVMLQHPDLTKVPLACTAGPVSNVARANNLLTPACGTAVAQAVFTAP